MRSIISIISFAYLFLFPFVSVRAEEARAILDRAIQSHGGEARLARTKVGHLKAKVEGAFAGEGSFNVTREETFDLPRRYKLSIKGTVNGKTVNTESAVNGRRGWVREGEGVPRDFSVQEPLPLEQHWHTFLAQLLLLRNKGTQLTTLNEEQRDDHTLVGIRVVSAIGTADLYFDKSTGLLARARRPLWDFMRRQKMIGETVYDEYREVGGVRYPMRINASSGEANFEKRTILSIEFLDKIDKSVFAKPDSPAVAADQPAGKPVDGEQENPVDSTPPPSSEPVHWDLWLILATLGMGIFVGVVWWIVRASKQRDAPKPPS